MELDRELSLEIARRLVDETGKHLAPATAWLHWLALTEGNTAIPTYCWVESNGHATAWTILGVSGRHLLMLHARANIPDWSFDNDGEGSVPLANVLPVEAVESLQVVGAKDGRSGQGTGPVELKTKWLVTVDGQKYWFPEPTESEAYDQGAVDRIITALRTARF